MRRREPPQALACGFNLPSPEPPAVSDCYVKMLPITFQLGYLFPCKTLIHIVIVIGFSPDSVLMPVL